MSGGQWFAIERDPAVYLVNAASRECAVRYLEQVIREPRPFEPGYSIWFLGSMGRTPLSRMSDGSLDAAAPSAVADGPVADDAEPVAAQAVVACPDTHRDDLDAMHHE